MNRTVDNKTMRINQLRQEISPGTTAPNESDSNADTCCLGMNFTVLSYTNRTADVYPYDDSYEPMTSVPIVSGATTYHHPNGSSYILVINEALYYGKKLTHTLINPNQIRHNGIGFWDNPYDSNHQLSIDIEEHGLVIPMKYQGTKLSFNSSLPTEQELNELPHIELTSNQPWNPGDVQLGEMGVKYSSISRVIKSLKTCVGNCNKIEIYNDKNQYEGFVDDDVLMSEINPTMMKLSEISSENYDPMNYQFEDIPPKKTLISTERHKKIDALTLAESWGIGPSRASAVTYDHTYI